MTSKLSLIYKKLYANFGRQHWWPGDTPFEVMVGAILTQNTNWQNVEKAIKNLKIAGVLSFKRLSDLPEKKLALLIRPAGYYNIKAGRLKEFLGFLERQYRGNISRMQRQRAGKLRAELLAVKGIGPETADSILLYALNKPAFVVDAYTRRIFSRHKLIEADATYEEIQQVFTGNLKRQRKLFNEYHALLVRLGKDYCLKRNPRCASCPLH